jgi:hypothetical protein
MRKMSVGRWPEIRHFSDFVDGLLDSLPNRFLSGATSFEKLLASQ